MQEYTFYEDPGHGWLAVGVDEILRLGVHPSKYSYRRGSVAYLEEDCDAPAFLRAKQGAGELYTIRRQYNENTPIRDYQRY